MIKFIERVGAAFVLITLACAIITIIFMSIGITWEDFR